MSTASAPPRTLDRGDRTDELRELMAERILVLDGATGTMLQSKNLRSDDFGGAELDGCNEVLVATRPDVILDVVAGIDERGLETEEIMSGWGALTELRAVREGKVRVLEGDLMVVPGPRLPELVARIAWALHPDREWEIR